MKGDEVGGACTKWERLEMHTKFYSDDLKRRNYLEDLDVYGRMCRLII
jgi:hypothetical protein